MSEISIDGILKFLAINIVVWCVVLVIYSEYIAWRMRNDK